MSGERLGRRAFCGWIGALGVVSIAPMRRRASLGAMPLEIEFWVAGSRYHAPRGFRPPVGLPVRLRLGRHRGQPCFEVHAAVGRIGYVPAELVDVFLRARPGDVRLTRVEPDRPCRQFRVRAELTRA